MDLSFRFPDPATAELPLGAASVDLAPLIALLGERQAASATAIAQAALDVPIVAIEPPLAPTHGAFSSAMAGRIVGWRADLAAGRRE